MLKICIESYLKDMGKPQKHFILIISNSEMGNCTTKGRTSGGELKLVEKIAEILSKKRLRNLGFAIPRGKITAREAVMLNRVKEELPSASDIAKADDIELQEIARSTEDLTAQFEGQETLPMRELLGLDKQLRGIRGSLKVEVAKKVQLEESLKKEKRKLEEL